MHACLLWVYDHASLLLILLWFILDKGHGYMLQRCLNKDRFSSCLRHTFGYTLFTCFISSRMMFELLTDSLFVAICHSNWLYSRKYRTAWYHPASSRFYLTFFILCQFQGKLTGTLPDSDARATCVKPANSACCVLGVRCWFYVNTWLTSCRRLLSKRSQLFVGSTLTR
jgi:hypothetical protein